MEEFTQSEVNYQQVRQAAQRLLSRVCTIAKENGNLLDVTMISDSEYIKDDGYFKIGISPQLKPYLFDLKNNFTSYQLRLFGALRSKYAKRIYKMLSQFKSTGIMRISVEELKKRLKLLDPKTGKEKFKYWTIFVKKVLEVAKRDINGFADLRFTYEAKKTGRKFTKLEFTIARVPHEQLKAKHGEDQATAGLRKWLVNKFQLSDWQTSDIAIHVPEKEIRKTLYEISVQLSDHRIRNVGGYAAKIFDNKYKLGFFEGSVPLSTHEEAPLDITKRSFPSTNREEGTPSIGVLMDKVAKVS